MKLIDKIRLANRVTTAMDKIQVHREIISTPEISLPLEDAMPDSTGIRKSFTEIVHSEDERALAEKRLAEQGYKAAGWSMYIERYTKGDSETVICMVY